MTARGFSMPLSSRSFDFIHLRYPYLSFKDEGGDDFRCHKTPSLRVSASTRYAAGLVCGFLGIAAVWFGLLIASFGYYETYGDRDLGAWYQLKGEALRATEGRPRIILAGGSNVLYGLSASQIERELGVPCVNYGTHAALPFDYMLDRWRRAASSGDLLVISPEWQYLQHPNGQMNDVFTGCVLSADPRYYWTLPLSARIHILLTASFRRLMMPVFGSRLENSREQEVRRELLGRLYFDANGDYVANHAQDRDRKELARLMEANVFFQVTPGIAPAGADSEYWKALRRFVNAMKRRGVLVAFEAPAVLALPDISNGKYEEFFADAEHRYRGLGLPILATLKENIYPPDMMFNSVYHLNNEGRDRRTAQLIRALGPLVKKRFPGTTSNRP